MPLSTRPPRRSRRRQGYRRGAAAGLPAAVANPPPPPRPLSPGDDGARRRRRWWCWWREGITTDRRRRARRDGRSQIPPPSRRPPAPHRHAAVAALPADTRLAKAGSPPPPPTARRLSPTQNSWSPLPGRGDRERRRGRADGRCRHQSAHTPRTTENFAGWRDWERAHWWRRTDCPEDTRWSERKRTVGTVRLATGFSARSGQISYTWHTVPLFWSRSSDGLPATGAVGHPFRPRWTGSLRARCVRRGGRPGQRRLHSTAAHLFSSRIGDAATQMRRECILCWTRLRLESTRGMAGRRSELPCLHRGSGRV